MFDIAWSEFLVVAVVALVVVGPRDLPALLRTVGKTIASLRRMAGEFQGQFNEAMREAELDGLKDEITGLKDSASKMVGASPFQIARDELKNALQDKPKPAPSALAGEAPKAEDAAAIPSALAPVVEPPAPSVADFKPPAGRQDAAKAAAKTSRSTKSNAAPKAAPKPRSSRPAAATTAKKAVNGAPQQAAKAEPPAKPKAAAKPKTAAKPKPPGASA